ncbi:MAG: 3-hydroxyacyl-CoA dehydrogenase/enoyl-CoA hydratase family protein, partial [Planctomycetes bacterium]|nr:3-hydroxyacyl-CoA dehydrogenase/enoyl-CoA hydratase family protein [Planctomycetota bacterium]
MAYGFRGLRIEKVGVIGSGQIGPDIALHFAKVFHADGVRTVVVDVAPEALQRGEAKLQKKVARGVESGAFSPEMAEALLASVTFTGDYAALANVDLVVEAATENEALKARIFQQVRELAAPDAIFASNSSHLEPEVIFAPFTDRSRCLVTHYFFPAERNPLVEVVPARDTDPAVTETMMGLYEAIGKVPIQVGSRYGYAIDPIFEGLLKAAALLVEVGRGTTREVDAVACRTLGLTVGPFTAHNLTGGNPLTDHGLDHMRERFGPWWGSPRLLKEALRSGEPWDVPGRGEKVQLPPEREGELGDALKGAYYGLVGQILDSGISNVADLEMALELGLDIAPPFRMMNRDGPARALELVENYRADHPEFVLPRCLEERARAGTPWEIDVVLRHDRDGIAVLTIRRPKVLNALNGDVFAQLARHIDAIGKDPAIRGAVITGFGTKAFVSGADINYLADNAEPEAALRTCEASKKPLEMIENLGKPVICALNGMALGGGNELAMACSARLCREGLKVAVSQPEPNLGIIPGAGATQRMPRLIGLERAAELLRTGRPLSGPKAVQYGLIREEVADDLVASAIRLARDAAAGKVALAPIQRGPLSVPAALPPVDIGHLSRAIDA